MIYLLEIINFLCRVYTADFDHSGPRLAIANCGHSGNCTLRHWIRSHDRAQYGSCTLGQSLAIANVDQNGMTHWHLPLWPQLAIDIGAQSGCHMVIYGYLLLFYFLYKNEKIRWFPCGTQHHSVSFIVKMVWGCTAGSFFFFFVTFIKIIYFGTIVLQMVPCGSCCFWLLYVNMLFGTQLVPIF